MGAAAAPMLIGSALGAVTNRRNPLQGALLGGVLGGVGGSFMGGFGGAGNAAATATMTGASPAATGVAMVPTAATPASALQGASSSIFANPSMPVYGATGGTTGLIGSTTAPVTLGERFMGGMNALKSDIGALNTFASQNPVATQVGLGAVKDVFSQQPQPALQSGLLRGSQVVPQKPPQYATAMPVMPQINLLG
jgi:hypothetical protein